MLPLSWPGLQRQTRVHVRVRATVDSLTCNLPPAAGIVTTYHNSRHENLPQILTALMDLCFFDKLVVWNNNPRYLLYSSSRSARIEIVNAGVNIGTVAKYEACLRSKRNYCYIIDDDWLPLHITSLYRLFLERNARRPVILTDAITQAMDFANSLDADGWHLGFGWLGVGSFISALSAQTFLKHHLKLIPNKYLQHADIFFCMFQGVKPLVLSAQLQPLAGNGHKARMSNAKSYETFLHLGKLKALEVVITRPTTFKRTVVHENDVERAICPGDDMVVTDNINCVSLMKNLSVRALRKSPTAFLHEDETLRKMSASHPFHALCDGTSTSSYVPLCFDLQTVRRIGYKMWNRMTVSNITLTFKLAHGEPEPKIKVYAQDGLSWNDINVVRKSSNVSSIPNHHRSKRQVSIKFEPICTSWIQIELFHELQFKYSDIQIVDMRLGSDDNSNSKLCEDTLDKTSYYNNKIEDSKVQLLVAISTTPIEVERRNAFREMISYWKTLTRGAIQFVFVLGSPTSKTIAAESSQHGDMLVLDVPDTYDLLALKTIKLLQWVVYDYGSVPHSVMKIDDDSYVQFDIALSKIKNMQSEYFLIGHVFTTQEVYHDLREKNYEPFYDGDIFPPYASGSGYILSMKLVRRLVEMSEVDPGLRILRNEDAALGMWIVGLNVTVEHDNTFWPEPPSTCSPNATLIHRQAVHMLKKLHRGKLSGDICSYET